MNIKLKMEMLDDFEYIINYLDLDIKENQEYWLLNDESLKKLEKTYKKVLKEL